MRDKAAVERFFRTLSEGLLAALPGYKGPDVHRRGKSPEEQAFYFLSELEMIIRQWTALYHQQPHSGLCVPEIPGLELSPLEMFGHGIARVGCQQVPARADLVFDFLKVEWRTIQHYGVEIGGLRYDGPALNGHRNETSPYTGRRAGRWPLRVDPGDVSRVWFQDPADSSWHALRWEHAGAVGGPFSDEALDYARRLAASAHRFPDTRRALAELLDRLWGITREHKGADHTLAALKSIRAARPDGYRLFVIMDNLAANKTPAIRRWARRENVELCFTPTNASWANPIEAQFGPVRTFVMGGSDHRNHPALARKLQDYLRWRNAHARHPGVLAAQRRERARIRIERQQRWGRPKPKAA